MGFDSDLRCSSANPAALHVESIYETFLLLARRQSMPAHRPASTRKV